MNLLDLLSEGQWNDFSREMHESYGISFGVSDTAGARVSSYANWCNRLCPRIKSDPQSLAAVCAVAANYFTEATRKSGEALIAECDLGLIKVAVPIVVGDEFMGTAGGCGFATERGEIETFMIEKLTGADEGEIKALVEDIAPMTEARAREMADDIARRIDAIVQRFENQG